MLFVLCLALMYVAQLYDPTQQELIYTTLHTYIMFQLMPNINISKTIISIRSVWFIFRCVHGSYKESIPLNCFRKAITHEIVLKYQASDISSLTSLQRAAAHRRLER